MILLHENYILIGFYNNFILNISFSWTAIFVYWLETVHTKARKHSISGRVNISE